MPSIPKNYPQSYADCERIGERKLGNNTYLVAGEPVTTFAIGDAATFSPCGQTRPSCYYVRLHHTNVVTFYRDGSVRLDTGGWNTPTTRLRFRACGFYVSKAEAKKNGPCWTVQGPVTQEAR